MKTVLIYAASWLGMVILAIVNGATRDRGYGPHMSKLAAHQLSTLIGLTLFGIYIWLFTGLRPIESSRQAVSIGATWFGMTVAFEFIFGHFVLKHTWNQLLEDYNLFKGRVWLLVPLWTAIAPYIFYRLRS